MQSVLIRFTKREYANSFIAGEVYMSSLAKFWDIRNNFEEQKDFFEGVAAINLKENTPLPDDMRSVIARYTRYRLEAYKYCNLLCFFRVDFDEKSRTLHLPPKSMMDFGDTCIIINNQEAFLSKISCAIKSLGGAYIAGDVRYHSVEDKRLYNRPSITLVSEVTGGGDSVFHLNQIPEEYRLKRRYGCLDKYDKYSNQKEWRVCYLPREYNTNDETVEVGALNGVATTIRSDMVYAYLLEKFKPCALGDIREDFRRTWGSFTYLDFQKKIEKIDDGCQLICDVI